MKNVTKLPELRIFLILAIVALAWHLFTTFSSVIASVADVFLLVFFAWLLAFIIDPAVLFVSKKGLSRLSAAFLVYLVLAGIFFLVLFSVLPAFASQISRLTLVLPKYFSNNSLWASRIEEFLNTTLGSSAMLASQAVSLVTGLILVFILSFYFLVSRREISKIILTFIPDEYEEDYIFLERTINTTFASFLRVQVFLGIILGAITFVVLTLLRVEFALSSSILSGLLAMVPVVGAILFIVPPALSALLVSPQQLMIVAAILILTAQLVYNVLAPRLIGKALNIHPAIVLLAFVVGYKVGGIWGSILAVPVTSAAAIIFRDFLKYWKEEADKNSTS